MYIWRIANLSYNTLLYILSFLLGNAENLYCEEHITNIFWAYAKMIIDYAHFGDVVTFDTTLGTNKEYRPFNVLLGCNQFRETTIFGAAIFFDETEDSYLWLFETFLANGTREAT